MSKDENLLSCLHVEATIDTAQHLSQCTNSMESNHSINATACSESNTTFQSLETSDESLKNKRKVYSHLL